jgi:acetolactate synthase-1/2/3 large subunit
MEQYQGSEAFLEVLNANGIESIFLNPGGDLAPIQAAVLRYKAAGKHSPRIVMSLHESVAMTAAHGHYMVSGKPQVVLVHSELGTQQVGGALHNAQWGRIPIILLAGLAASPKRVTWKQEPYEQNAMVRNCVKWDYQTAPGEDIQDVLKRAIEVAMTEPRGPVYLSYTRDLLTARVGRRPLESLVATVPTMPPADRSSLARIADILLEAKNPLIMAGYTERYHESVKNLIELAETACVPVTPGLTRMNFPTTHPLCAGMEEMGGGSKGNIPLTEADVVLAIDYDLPYVPAEGTPKKDAIILHIDVDPLTVGRPLWGRGADIFVKADSREAIPALTRILREKITPEKEAQLRERFKQLEQKHKKQREERRVLARSKSNEKPISPDWLAYCINEILNEDMVLVNHLKIGRAHV